MTHAFSNKFGKKLRGVNLGGWLVLEKWITPSLFEGLEATDETTYCAELGERADTLLKQHWNSYITREDFAWLAKTGINAVRLPVGHWLFGADYPYHRSYGEARHPFVVGGLDIVDKVFDWAEEFGYTSYSTYTPPQAVKMALTMAVSKMCVNGTPTLLILNIRSAC